MKRRTGVIIFGIIVGVLIALAVVVGIVALAVFDVTGKRGSGLEKAFVYDIQELVTIDPNLILYEESGQAIRTGFKAAHGIALGADERIYVAGDKAVEIFEKSGTFSGRIEIAGAPRCLTVADDGEIYIGVGDHVEVYDGRGKRLASWGSLGEKALLTSIAVFKNDVFAADAGNRIVVRYDLAGKVVNRIGKKDPDRNVPGFVVPSPYFDLAVPKDGLLRVVNTGRRRIEAYTFDGDFEFSWGEASAGVEGFCGCCNPVNFAILPGGGFVTCEKGLVRVKVYNSEGIFVGVVAGPEQLVGGGICRVCEFPAECQASGFDVAVDGDGRIFVLDTIKNVVRIFGKIKGQ